MVWFTADLEEAKKLGRYIYVTATQHDGSTYNTTMMLYDTAEIAAQRSHVPGAAGPSHALAWNELMTFKEIETRATELATQQGVQVVALKFPRLLLVTFKTAGLLEQLGE
jgi:hypothetical protein